MKAYTKPTIEFIELKPEERLACGSGTGGGGCCGTGGGGGGGSFLWWCNKGNPFAWFCGGYKYNNMWC